LWPKSPEAREYRGGRVEVRVDQDRLELRCAGFAAQALDFLEQLRRFGGTKAVALRRIELHPERLEQEPAEQDRDPDDLDELEEQHRRDRVEHDDQARGDADREERRASQNGEAQAGQQSQLEPVERGRLAKLAIEALDERPVGGG
jgi:hypothetical protein